MKLITTRACNICGKPPGGHGLHVACAEQRKAAHENDKPQKKAQRHGSPRLKKFIDFLITSE